MCERIVFGLVRFAGKAIVLIGACSLVAAVPLVPFAAGNGVASQIARAAVIVGGTLLIAGVAAAYVARPKQRFPADARGGSSLLPIALLLISALMLTRLGPLAALWREALVLMNEGRVWEDLRQSAGMSGVVLLPIVAALTVPTLAVAAATAFVLGALVVLMLTWRRSAHLTRAYVSCLLIQTALGLATIYGASLTREAAGAIERETLRLDTRNEAADILERLRRYDAAIASTATTVAWTLGAFAVGLVPFMLVSRANTPTNEVAPAHASTSLGRTGPER